MNTDSPNITAETTRPSKLGKRTGILDPIAIAINMNESGAPSLNLANIGFQKNGEMQMHRPRVTQTDVIDSADNFCDTIHAEINVRYTM
jgi:hypothetical protein